MASETQWPLLKEFTGKHHELNEAIFHSQHLLVEAHPNLLIDLVKIFGDGMHCPFDVKYISKNEKVNEFFTLCYPGKIAYTTPTRTVRDLAALYVRAIIDLPKKED